MAIIWCRPPLLGGQVAPVQAKMPYRKITSKFDTRLCGSPSARYMPLPSTLHSIMSNCRAKRRPALDRPPTAVAVAAAASAPAQTALCAAGWPLWTCMAACAALSQVVERRTRIGTYLSAPLLATFFALAAAAAGVIPTASGIYDTIWSYLLPLAASLYLLECDISRLFAVAGQSVVAFFNGALGTVLGTVIAFAAVGRYLGPDGAQVAAALCASYIGGSVNFAAVAALLGLSSGSTMAAMTADNLCMAAYIAILMSIPARLPAALEADAAVQSSAQPPGSVTAESVSLALAAGALACGLGNALARWAGFSAGGLAFTAVLSSGIAAAAGFVARSTTAPTQNSVHINIFSGAEALGSALMMMFFATIGAAAGSFSALAGSGWLLVFIAVQLSVQLTVSLGLGRAMSIPLPVVLIAANANVGGPATAAAMAGAKGWRSLVQPAILTGALGYAIANGVGWAMGSWLQRWYVFV